MCYTDPQKNLCVPWASILQEYGLLEPIFQKFCPILLICVPEQIKYLWEQSTEFLRLAADESHKSVFYHQ